MQWNGILIRLRLSSNLELPRNLTNPRSVTDSVIGSTDIQAKLCVAFFGDIVTSKTRCEVLHLWPAHVNIWTRTSHKKSKLIFMRPSQSTSLHQVVIDLIIILWIFLEMFSLKQNFKFYVPRNHFDLNTFAQSILTVIKSLADYNSRQQRFSAF